ncbi:hypothetical protein ACKWTF_008557 [Chironomus riparius]
MSSTPQKKGKVPEEVAKLYGGGSSKNKNKEQRTKHYNLDKTRNKFWKINDFFNKSSDIRGSRFNENREIRPAENTAPTDETLTEINSLLTSAFTVSNEYEQLTKCDERNVDKLFTVMGNMNKTMLELITQLKNAIILKNEATINKFTNELKSCTSFISNEINHVKKEIRDIKRNDETECLRVIHLCSRDLKRVWIRFAYSSDAEYFRDKNSFTSIKELLSQLNIKINMAQYPIESFFYQSKKFSSDQIMPEIALCCIFVNQTLASVVKNGIRKFNKGLEENGQSTLIRYKVNTDWSYEIRSILKPCNEMIRFKVIDKVYITNDGLKVFHKELHRQNNSTYTSSFVNSLSKLDSLRKKLQDFNCTVPTLQAYNSDYFAKTVEERLKIREAYDTQLHSNIEEYDVSQDDEMDASIVSTASQPI